MLAAEGLCQHLPKGYLYFAMGFSALVELLNLRACRRAPRDRPPERAAPPAEPPAELTAARQR